MPATRADLTACLEALGIAADTVEHPPLFTVEESRALRGEIPGGHTKNLFLKDKKDQVFLVVAEEDAAIDMKSLHKAIGSARLSFGKSELLLELLGVIPGSVTPFGVLNDTGGRENLGAIDFLRFLNHVGHEPAVLAVSGIGSG